jgi:protein tyrosine phosphatase (PTP) superfamily phosphohydrolase (DUF442 family)
MMSRLLGSLCLAALGVLGLQGCKHCKSSCGPGPAPCGCNGSVAVPGRVAPMVPAVGDGIPAAPIPVAPAAVGVAPIGPSVPPTNSLPPVSARYGPSASLQCPQPALPPAPPGVRLAVPAPVITDTRASPAAPLPQGPIADAAAPLPVGIKQFAKPKTQVATGLKPDLDGLDWLQAKGYKTVLHLVQTGEDDAAERRQSEEKRNIKYLSLTVAPATLDRATIEQFNQIIGDPSNLPLFVYDKDGMLAGGMWYLHFRTADFATEEEARAKATRLGLKEDPNGEHKVMWDAIKKYFTGKVQ